MKEKIFLIALLLLLSSVAAQTQTEKSYVLTMKYTLKSDSFELLGINVVDGDSPDYVLESADYYAEFANGDGPKYFFNVPNIVYSEPDPDINMFDEQGNQIYFPDEADIINKEEITEFSIVLPYSETSDKLSIKDKTGKEKLSVDLTALKMEKKLESEMAEPKGNKFDFSRDVLKNPIILPILLIATLIIAIIFVRELKNEKQKS
ncbi:MAG: hypothetical protein COT15_00185 [Candidatus Diapherotrites archaeon CG08_land_8_20_14_0_20_34_12]|nr:MAG: hypothetical protein COT15_00185 [Candidatus Diapherotrites archaeon CG08_land_8_20_14_0_20_34_12]